MKDDKILLNDICQFVLDLYVNISILDEALALENAQSYNIDLLTRLPSASTVRCYQSVVSNKGQFNTDSVASILLGETFVISPACKSLGSVHLGILSCCEDVGCVVKKSDSMVQHLLQPYSLLIWGIISGVLTCKKQDTFFLPNLWENIQAYNGQYRQRFSVVIKKHGLI